MNKNIDKMAEELISTFKKDLLSFIEENTKELKQFENPKFKYFKFLFASSQTMFFDGDAVEYHLYESCLGFTYSDEEDGEVHEIEYFDEYSLEDYSLDENEEIEKLIPNIEKFMKEFENIAEKYKSIFQLCFDEGKYVIISLDDYSVKIDEESAIY